MQQILKKYKKTGNHFIEDSLGYCIGFEWTDAFNIKRRVIYTSSIDDLIKQTTNTCCEVQWLDPIDTLWKTTEKKEFVAHQRTYINTTNGQIEPNPFVTTVDIIDGETVESQVLKPNLITEFQYLYNYQFQLFQNILKGIQVRNFSATSFG